MAKGDSSTAVSLKDRAVRPPAGETIWCIHYECYKYVNVCERCRVRIKCVNYLEYWAPRFDF